MYLLLETTRPGRLTCTMPAQVQYEKHFELLSHMDTRVLGAVQDQHNSKNFYEELDWTVEDNSSGPFKVSCPSWH